jgi:aspartyl-tRNA(Asn)/glutamyl-tRNA(Gln) amidotransferase subunit B
VEAALVERPELVERLESLRGRGLSDDEAVLIGLDDVLFRLFEEGIAAGGPLRALINRLANDVRALLRERGDVAQLRGGHLADIVGLVEAGHALSSVARRLIAACAEGGASAEAALDSLGLRTVRDEGPLRAMIAAAIAQAPDKVAAYLGGRVSLKGYFVGAAMRGSGGKADPALVSRLVDEMVGVPPEISG